MDVESDPALPWPVARRAERDGSVVLIVRTTDPVLVGALREALQDCEPLTTWADRTLSWGEAAAYLGVSPRTLSRWVDAGTVPVHRVGRGRFLISDLDAYMRSTRRGFGDVGIRRGGGGRSPSSARR